MPLFHPQLVFFMPCPKETRTITEVTPTITPKAVNPLLRGVEIIDRKAKIIASNIFTITPGLPFHLSFL